MAIAPTSAASGLVPTRAPRWRLFRSLSRKEWPLGVGLLTSLAFLWRGRLLLNGLADPRLFGLVSLWLFATVLGSALSMVRHAEKLAIRLGEPYGTLILTLSVTAIEVTSISAVSLHGHGDATLTRDTLFSVVMIFLDGMVGLSLLLGAWRHREQQYNLQGANTYLGLIIPLAVLSLILPDFTRAAPGPKISTGQSIFLILATFGLYLAFLVIQTSRHRGYFVLEEEQPTHADEASDPSRISLVRHGLLLGLYMLPVLFLVEQLARPIDYLIDTAHAPRALGGLVIAVIVATPEAIGAVRAALADRLQRAMNIFLGSVLSTIGLTVPAMLLISLTTRQSISLGLENTDIVMLPLTLGVSAVTFASGRTNVLQGAVHLLLFAAYLLLIFER
jgi:Ca2+:H+ antiporter